MIKDMTHCTICGAEDVLLTWLGDGAFCKECEEFERTFDIDAYEEERRRKIAEANEY